MTKTDKHQIPPMSPGQRKEATTTACENLSMPIEGSPMTDNLPVKTTPQDLLTIAVKQNVDIDKLEKLMELQERYEKREAEKSYASAMTKFKANAPEIIKDAEVKFEAKGRTTKYNHTRLATLIKIVSPFLSENGLSMAWKTDQNEKGIMVTCVVTHELGHSEQTSLTAGPDTTGSKNSIQAIGSTITFLKRYTGESILGLAEKEDDDDGKGSEPEDMINEQQKADINTLKTDLKTKDADFDAWLQRRYGVSSVEKLTRANADKTLMIMNAQLEEKNAGNN